MMNATCYYMYVNKNVTVKLNYSFIADPRLGAIQVSYIFVDGQ